MKSTQVPCQVITPEIARHLLASNAESLQRKINKRHVEILRRRIAAGKWDADAGVFCVDSSGRLTDGQHRLRAIIAENATVSARVIRAEWSSYRDDTRRRSVADRTGTSQRVAAIARLLGRLINLQDADEAVDLFDRKIKASGILEIPECKPFGCAAAIAGGFLAETQIAGSGINCLNRLRNSSPETRSERALCSAAMRGQLSTTGSFQREFIRLVFNAATRRRHDHDEIQAAAFDSRW